MFFLGQQKDISVASVVVFARIIKSREIPTATGDRLFKTINFSSGNASKEIRGIHRSGQSILNRGQTVAD